MFLVLLPKPFGGRWQLRVDLRNQPVAEFGRRLPENEALSCAVEGEGGSCVARRERKLRTLAYGPAKLATTTCCGERQFTESCSLRLDLSDQPGPSGERQFTQKKEKRKGKKVQIQCCFMCTETVMTVRDGLLD